MYRINYLSRPVLITVDEVLAKATIDQDADIRFLLNSIEVAEERYIAPALGDAFYEDFINQKNITITSANQAAMLTNINNSLAAATPPKAAITIANIPIGTIVNSIDVCPANYQTLWNRFLWKIVAEAVDLCAIVPSWTRTTAQGQMQNHPKTLSSDSTGSATADRKDIEYKIDTNMQQRVYPLIARMKKWIGQNGGYPLFPYEPSDKGGTDKQGKGGIILGLYEDRSYNGPNLWQFGSWDEGYYRRRREEPCAAPSPAPNPTPSTVTTWRSIQIFIVENPDPNALLAVGGGHTIQAQYSPGQTVTPMKIGDAAGYLAGRPYQMPIFIDGLPMTSNNYNSAEGIFTGGYSAGDNIIMTFLDNV